jgi:hypothetical protein
MIGWLRKRSLPTRVLIYAVAVLLAFVVAASVGAMAALMLQGNLSLPGNEEPRPSEQQGGDQGDTPESRGADADGSQQEGAGAGQREAAPQQDQGASQLSEAVYVSKVGSIQAEAVETFLDSHDSLLRYDALTADDVEEMQANKDALQGFTEQVDGLDPPQRYSGEHFEAFSSAIRELHRASALAYNLAADPTAATQSGFDEYDRHVNEAAAGLERSNEILGRDYKTIEGVQKVNPLS